MNKITFIASALLFTAVQAFAQKEFKLAKSSGRLIINNISNLSVEGYEGKDIVFTTTSKQEKTNDPRAAGLSALSNVGFDNTGVGISVTEKENVTIVSPIERELTLKVKLPKSVALSFKTTGFATGDSTVISLSNIQSEVDASTQYEHVSLKNVSGPVSLKTLYGNIEGKLTPSFKGPISLVSVYGFIDVTVPENTKADMAINTTYETLYAAKDIKLIMDENPKKENFTYASALTSSSTGSSGQNVHVYTLDSSAPAKVKGTGITGTTSNSATGTNDNTIKITDVALGKTGPALVINSKSTAPTEVKGKAATVVSNLPFSYSYDSSISSTFSSRGTIVNGKLNGGGEKIVLKSTYGKIYLRK